MADRRSFWPWFRLWPGEPECPVQAIFPDTDVPTEWTAFIDKHYRHFNVDR
jgi:hypothetical protein